MSKKRTRSDRIRVICQHHCKLSSELKLIQFRSLPDHYKKCHKTDYDRNNAPYYLPSDPYGILHCGLSVLSASIKQEPQNKRQKINPSPTKTDTICTNETKTNIATISAPKLVIPPLPSITNLNIDESKSNQINIGENKSIIDDFGNNVLSKIKNFGLDIMTLSEYIINGIKDAIFTKYDWIMRDIKQELKLLKQDIEILKNRDNTKQVSNVQDLLQRFPWLKSVKYWNYPMEIEKAILFCEFCRDHKIALKTEGSKSFKTGYWTLLNVTGTELYKITKACKGHEKSEGHKANHRVLAKENRNVMMILMKYAYTNILFGFSDCKYEKRLHLLSHLNIGIYGIGNRHHSIQTMRIVKEIFYKLTINKIKHSMRTINPGLF